VIAVPRPQQAITRGQLVVHRTDYEQESLLNCSYYYYYRLRSAYYNYHYYYYCGKSAYHYYY
jgi:hypothetical protein